MGLRTIEGTGDGVGLLLQIQDMPRHVVALFLLPTHSHLGMPSSLSPIRCTIFYTRARNMVTLIPSPWVSHFLPLTFTLSLSTLTQACLAACFPSTLKSSSCLCCLKSRFSPLKCVEWVGVSFERILKECLLTPLSKYLGDVPALAKGYSLIQLTEQLPQEKTSCWLWAHREQARLTA